MKYLLSKVKLSRWFPNQSFVFQSNTSKNKGVRFDTPVEAKPQLGLAYIRHITGHALCRELVLNRNSDDLITVVTLLKDIVVSVYFILVWKNLEKKILSKMKNVTYTFHSINCYIHSVEMYQHTFTNRPKYR